MFNDSTTQEGLTGTARYDAADSWLLITTRIWKVEPLANKVARTKEIEVWYQQLHRRTHGYDEQRSRAEAYAHMNNGEAAHEKRTKTRCFSLVTVGDELLKHPNY